MEFCGFGGSNIGSQGWSNEGLSNLLADLMETASAPMLVGVSSPDLVVEIPTFYSLVESAQNLLDGPMSKQIGIGFIATALVCGFWSFHGRKNPSKQKTKNSKTLENNLDSSYSLHRVDGLRSLESGEGACLEIKEWTPPKEKDNDTILVGGDNQENAVSKDDLHSFQKQLMSVLVKLDQARLQLNELESDKDLLVAELEVRQKVLEELQEENKEEREKRQKAEMRMEVMEYENSQLKKMRRELTVKAGQLERLAKCVKDKEEYQAKLFEENVVLPKSVAQARAVEFADMQARLQILEARLIGVGNQGSQNLCVTRSASSMSSFAEKVDFCWSDQSLFKGKKLIKAPEWRSRTFSPLSGVAVDFALSPTLRSLAFSGNSRDIIAEKQTNELLSKSVIKPLLPNPDKDSLPKRDMIVKTNSPEACLPSKSSQFSLIKPSSPTIPQASHVQNNQKPKTPESDIPSAHSMFLSASCGSISEDQSPSLLHSFPASNRVSSPSKMDTLKQNAGTDSSTINTDTKLESKAKCLDNLTSGPGGKSRQTFKLKSLFSSKSKDFQIHYQPRLKEVAEIPEKKPKEEGGNESDDSWCVIVPK